MLAQLAKLNSIKIHFDNDLNNCEFEMGKYSLDEFDRIQIRIPN